jgi:UDP:flavonoid glycosyltransferase YjiC (YdhE family)
MVPLAKAFEAAGHRVAFATDPGFVRHVRGLGFEAFPAGLDMPVARRLFAESMPGFGDLPASEEMRYLMPGLFGGVRVQPMLDDLDRILPDWRPDLLVHESAEMAGAIAAEGLAVPHVEHAFGVLRPTDIRRRATDAIASVAERRGVTNPGVGGFNGELYLDICPPRFQQPEIADVPHVQPLRPMPFDEAPDVTLPDWLTALGSRPLVYVTMGTAFNKELAVFRAILDGLAGEPFEVVVTVGPSGDPESLRPYADNVRVERFIAQSAILPLAAVFVSHGGSGATLGTLRAGIPMLAIPQGADQFLNAGRVVDTGVGLRLMPDEVSAGAVRDAVRALLDDHRYRDAARGHQVSIEDLPLPDAVVPILAALAQG